MKDDRTRDRDTVGSGLDDMKDTSRGSEKGGSRSRELDRDRNVGSGSQSGQGSSRSSGDMGGSRNKTNGE